MNLKKLFVAESDASFTKLMELVEKHKSALKKFQAGLDYGIPANRVLYHMFRFCGDAPSCKVCGSPVKFHREDYRTYCGRECMGKDPDFRNKISAAATLSAQDPVKKRKHQLAQQRRWQGKIGKERRAAVSRQWENPETVAKRRATCLAKYGVEHQSQSAEFRKKFRRTCRTRYGVNHPLQHEEFKRKARRTSRKRFGTDYALQNPAVAKKQQESAYRRHDVTIRGKSFSYQGYEKFLLQELVERYGPSRVDSDPCVVPSIRYRLNGRRAVYIPDIFVSAKNRVYEVKSAYTAGLTSSKFRSYFDKLTSAAAACRESGLDFWLVVYDKKGNRLLKTRLETASYDKVRNFLRYGVVGGY